MDGNELHLGPLGDGSISSDLRGLKAKKSALRSLVGDPKSDD